MKHNRNPFDRDLTLLYLKKALVEEFGAIKGKRIEPDTYQSPDILSEEKMSTIIKSQFRKQRPLYRSRRAVLVAMVAGLLLSFLIVYALPQQQIWIDLKNGYTMIEWGSEPYLQLEGQLPPDELIRIAQSINIDRQ